MTRAALDRLPRGWFHHGEQILARLEQHRPAVVVELGTHLGASAIAMARVIRPWGGVVYCVDTWYGVPRPGLSPLPIKIYECGRHLALSGVSPAMRLICATTLDAAACWRTPAIDCLYVDADHGHQGCLADLEAWAPHLAPGALILGDDYGHPNYPGVRTAWTQFAADHNLTLHVEAPHDTTPPGMQLVWTVWP